MRIAFHYNTGHSTDERNSVSIPILALGTSNQGNKARLLNPGFSFDASA